MAVDAEIVYDDRWLTVVNKPHGLQTEPDRLGHPDLVTATSELLKKSGKTVRFLQPVNRLDRPTCGLVLLAKTPSVLKALNRMQEERKIKKEYTALLEGEIMESKGIWEHFLLKDPMQKRALISGHPLPLYKLCVLEWKVMETGLQSTLVQIRLKTGRYHQIRAQSSFMGHPVWGDVFYGSGHSVGENVILLCAGKLAFTHPQTGGLLEFEAPCSFSVI